MELSLNETAEILGMSSQLVVRRLDAGDIPFGVVGTDRLSVLRDVLAFRDRERDQKEAMSALADDADEPGRDHGV